MHDTRLGQIVTPLGEAQARQARRDTALVVLALSMLGFLGLEIWRETRGYPAYFPPQSGPGIARAGVVDEGEARDFAMRIIHECYSFGPETIQATQAACRPWLHPALRTTFDAQFAADSKEVKRLQMQTLVKPLEATKLERKDTAIVFRVQAWRSVSVGDTAKPGAPIQYDVLVMTWPRSGRPQGLIVGNIKETPELR